MISITLEECLEKIKESNPDTNIEKAKKALEDAIILKKNNIKCSVCGNPIWAMGSALCERNMCFSCITGEVDDSEDYEIDKVNY